MEQTVGTLAQVQHGLSRSHVQEWADIGGLDYHFSCLRSNPQRTRVPEHQQAEGGCSFLAENSVDIAFLQEANFYAAHDAQMFHTTFGIPSYFSLASP